MSYDPLEYWTTLHGRDGLTAVGQSGLPTSINRWLYATMARRLERFASTHDLRPKTVYDVGAGTGYWVAWWTAHGAVTVHGCDLVPVAVDRLRARFPGEFDILDIAEGSPPRTYDLVSILNVLLHITDESRFEAALRNLAAAVAPGGYLLMVEPLQVGRGFRQIYPRGSSSLARPAEAYVRPLAEAGLELVSVQPATVIGSDPIEAANRLAFDGWMALWRLSKLPAKFLPAAGGLVGRIIYAVDPALLRAGRSPSAKIVVFRRPA